MDENQGLLTIAFLLLRIFMYGGSIAGYIALYLMAKEKNE